MDPRLLLLVPILLLGWVSIIIYSKRRYPMLPCATCGGGGKDFEPWWMAWVCGRRVRAFAPCPACGGSARTARPRGWR